MKQLHFDFNCIKHRFKLWILLTIVSLNTNNLFSQTACNTLLLDSLYLEEISNKFNVSWNVNKIKILNDTTIKISKKLKQITTFKVGNKINKIVYKKVTLIEIQYVYYDNKCIVAMI
ncbi:MAG TPA: hypothetical protein VGF79_10445, partial [Bacteroidia bacterium]